jgi:hypothetical protein
VKVAIVLLLATGTAAADTYTVAKDGDDAGPGTRKRPWQTLQHAAERVVAGDTVTVLPGAYAGFQLRHRGKAGAPIIFVGDGASIEGDNGTTPDGIDFAGVAYAELRGFAIRRASRDGVRVEQSEHVTVTGITVEDVGQAGVTIDDSRAVSLAGVHVTRAGAIGIQVTSGGAIELRTTTVTGAHDDGIALGPVAGATLDALVVTGSGGHGIVASGTHELRVTSSLVFANHAFGVSLDAPGAALLHDTIVAGTGQYAVKLDAGATGASVLENILLATDPVAGGGAIWASPRCFPFTSDRNAVTPSFGLGRRLAIDLEQWRLQTKQDATSFAGDASLFAAAGDFQLAPASAAIDKGTLTSLGPTDLAGHRRVVHGRADLGAYEVCGNDCTAPGPPPIARDARGCCDGGGGGSLFGALGLAPLARRRRRTMAGCHPRPGRKSQRPSMRSGSRYR